ncbi:hypothetical protein BKA70DRAFT_657483 [Coprinopsis sp. MPI-PUGE-AT-0042]|nr:hypothetical protein BKA70DRAFT_657483 [Coprinopsis sp. MPI-PUGE-AT-0042]
METPLAYGRRRLTRTGLGNVDDSVATTASSLQAGPSRLPELTQLVDVDFSDLESDNLESDEHATPRIQALNKLPSAENDLQTPAARLRAILSRVPNGSLSPDATPVATQPPKSVANYESDSDMDISTQVNRAPSAAHTSIRSIFSNALRPPGDTPQKQQQRPRRNSIDTSEVETSPRLERGQHRAKRKSLSLSDEEVENLYRHSRKSQPSFKSKPQHSGLDVLRQRFMNTSGDEGTSQQDGDLSDDTADLLRELNSSRASPPAATSTPQQSMQMSMNSGFQLQSNLLDHDSEMQRFIDNADTYEDFPSKFVEPANASEVEQNVDFPSNSAPEDDPPDTPERPSSPPRTSTHFYPLCHPRLTSDRLATRCLH